MGTLRNSRIAKRDLAAMREIEAMTDEELDAEIRSYGLDPDKLAKHAFNRVCEALRQKSIECASANTKVAALEQRIGVLERALKEAMVCDACDGEKTLWVPPCCNCYGDPVCTHKEEEIECPACLGAGLRDIDSARAALAETEKGEIDARA